LQLLEAEFEDDEASSSEEEDNIILQTVLIQRLNTRYFKPWIYHVTKSKD
ncbi:6806_t:CDS:1, partial [Funneliformis caledonium]